MQVIATKEVENFISKVSYRDQEKIRVVIKKLETKGHLLFMPYAKPVGGGIWELRIHSQSAVRILYGFVHGTAVLLVPFKKQKSAIPTTLLQKAKELLIRIEKG